VDRESVILDIGSGQKKQQTGGRLARKTFLRAVKKRQDRGQTQNERTTRCDKKKFMLPVGAESPRVQGDVKISMANIT